MPERSCRHCRWWTYRRQKVGKELRDYPGCDKWVGGFPDAAPWCHYFEREPGSDDE